MILELPPYRLRPPLRRPAPSDAALPQRPIEAAGQRKPSHRVPTSAAALESGIAIRESSLRVPPVQAGPSVCRAGDTRAALVPSADRPPEELPSSGKEVPRCLKTSC